MGWKGVPINGLSSAGNEKASRKRCEKKENGVKMSHIINVLKPEKAFKKETGAFSPSASGAEPVHEITMVSSSTFGSLNAGSEACQINRQLLDFDGERGLVTSLAPYLASSTFSIFLSSMSSVSPTFSSVPAMVSMSLSAKETGAFSLAAAGAEPR